MEKPIIKQFEHQECIGYEMKMGRFVSIIKNIAIDASGKRWQFYTDYYTVFDNNGMGTRESLGDYNWTELA